MARSFHLVSISHSHYVEKARWALEHFGVGYGETRVLPLVHWAVTPWYVTWRGSPDTHSTRFSTPILCTDRDGALSGSSTIMRYLGERFADARAASLFPSDEAVELDEHYNRHLGPHTRRVFYHHLLPDREEACRLAERNASPLQARAFELLYPVFRFGLRKGLGITDERAGKSMERVRREFDQVGRRLGDGRPYLTGDRLTAADIAFACLGGALMLPQPPEGWEARLPDAGNGDRPLAAIARELRETDAGQWVLRLFRERLARKPAAMQGPRCP